MQQYLNALRHVQDNGRGKADRTGTGTRSVFGYQMRFNLADGFPLLTTKKLFTRGIIAELLWILSGDTKEKTLRDQNVNFWAEWAPKGRELTLRERVDLYTDEQLEHAPSHEELDALGIPRREECDGDLGRVYGAQWRNWQSVSWFRDGQGYMMPKAERTDQIANLIRDLKANPTSRRHIVTGWNPGELDQMALPPCHMMFQFYCEELTDAERVAIANSRGLMKFDGVDVGAGPTPNSISCDAKFRIPNDTPRYRLSCQLYQRSADIFLGVPFNIASYAALTMMVAQCVNMVPGDFVHTFGDLHVYNNHFEQVKLQLSREPRPLPRLKLNPDVKDIFSFKPEDFSLEGYDPHPAIKAEVSV